MNREYVAYFDGCCEPINPGGTASYGAVIFKDNERIWECSEIFFPEKGKEKHTSNNVAEYSGLIAILEWFIENELQDKGIQIFGDSNLVISQMFGDVSRGNRKWRIKSGFYKTHALRAQQLLTKFNRIYGQWIPREENGIADELSKAKLKKAGIKFKLQQE